MPITDATTNIWFPVREPELDVMRWPRIEAGNDEVEVDAVDSTDSMPETMAGRVELTTAPMRRRLTDTLRDNEGMLKTPSVVDESTTMVVEMQAASMKTRTVRWNLHVIIIIRLSIVHIEVEKSPMVKALAAGSNGSMCKCPARPCAFRIDFFLPHLHTTRYGHRHLVKVLDQSTTD